MPEQMMTGLPLSFTLPSQIPDKPSDSYEDKWNQGKLIIMQHRVDLHHYIDERKELY